MVWDTSIEAEHFETIKIQLKTHNKAVDHHKTRQQPSYEYRNKEAVMESSLPCSNTQSTSQDPTLT